MNLIERMIKAAFACYRFVTNQYANHYISFSFSCIMSRIFPTKWKMVNVVPIYKQDDKQNVENYQAVSLRPIFGKIFEDLIYNEIYTFFYRK